MPERGFDFKNLDLSNESGQKKFDEEFEILSEEEKSAVINAAEEEALERLEKELSPEAIERIIEKVQDIDEDGIAYTVIGIADTDIILPLCEINRPNFERFKEVLAHGILGKTGDYVWKLNESRKMYGSHTEVNWHELDKEGRKKIWAESVRDYHNRPPKNFPYHRDVNTGVCFNIVGRSEELKNRRPEIMRSNWMAGRGDKIGIIFDLSSFKEISSEYSSFQHTYTNQRDDVGYTNIGKDSNSEYGFELASRVAPRFFEGIFFRCAKKNEKDEYHIVQDENVNQKRAEEIVAIMKEAYKDRSDLLVPVYDSMGNLYWPKQMSYEEVKKIVKEREMEKNK